MSSSSTAAPDMETNSVAKANERTIRDAVMGSLRDVSVS
jgi:hypothetical protein